MVVPFRAAGLAVGVLLLAACGTTDMSRDYEGRPVGEEGAVTGPPPADGPVKIGKPYRINGVWYHPEDDKYYDRMGIASWYGPTFHGRRTANGETFDMNRISAAHNTLPMPSYVRVTNLENGRSMVVRINDRGPFARGRIIDLSRRAAELLGFRNAGTARVRVQRVRPDGTPYGTEAAEADVPETRWITPDRYEEVEKRPVQETDLYVQVGAFANKTAAERVKLDIEWIAPAVIMPLQIDGRTLHRVRLGPLGSVDQADAALADVVDFGYMDSRIVLE